MKMISSTRQISTNGVTLMSLLSPLPPSCMDMTCPSLSFRAGDLLGDERDFREPGFVGLDHVLPNVAVLHRLVRLDEHGLVGHSIVDLGHLGLVLIPRNRLLLDEDR